MNDDERKYLDIIQATISRLAGNSFQMKGWAVGLASVIIGLTAKDLQSRFALLALIPVFAFWGLDAYYLALERLYRDRFNAATGLAGSKPRLFDMNAGSVSPRLWRRCLRSASVRFTHAPIALIAIAVALFGPGNVHDTNQPHAANHTCRDGSSLVR